MIQILEILETINESAVGYVLRLINQIVENNSEIQENLCLVGGLPAILNYAESKYDKSIRVQVAKFLKQVSHGSKFTHQMFIACRGLPYLVGFLSTTNYDDDKDLVFMAIDGIQSVFNLQVLFLIIPPLIPSLLPLLFLSLSLSLYPPSSSPSHPVLSSSCFTLSFLFPLYSYLFSLLPSPLLSQKNPLCYI